MSEKPNRRAILTIEAETESELQDAIAMLKLGAHELLTGRHASTHEHGGPHAFYGELEITQLTSPTPFLLALVRQLLLAQPTHQHIATIAGRIWLATHCLLCARPVELDQQSAEGDALCTDCQVLLDQPGGIDHLARTEQIKIDQQTISAFLGDPSLSEADRDKFYLLTMAPELQKSARAGFRAAGRGAVVLDYTGAGAPQSYYVDSHTAAHSGIGWPAPEVEEMVWTYNPATEMIVTILRHDTSHTYRIAFDGGDWLPRHNPFSPSEQTVSAA